MPRCRSGGVDWLTTAHRGKFAARTALDARHHARWFGRPGARRDHHELEEQNRLRVTEDFKEGVKVIPERRVPNFAGR
jgi:hypothetical protein